MATSRHLHCTVLYRKRAVAIGGKSNATSLALCEQQDSATKKWTPFPSLPQTRFFHGACVLNDRIYVCGGVVNGTESTSIEVFDGEKWSMLETSLSEARKGHSCLVWEGKVVVFGGNKEDIEVYDEDEKRWRRDLIPKMSIARNQEWNAVSF